MRAEAALAPFGVEAQHPDLFIDNLFDLDPAAWSRPRNGKAPASARVATSVISTGTWLHWIDVAERG